MKKILFSIMGSICLSLGIVGILLPVIPTTPFLLLSSWFYMRSSSKLYNFVLSNKYLSPYLKDYITGNGISTKSKKKAIFMIGITIGFSVIFFVNKPLLRTILIVIASIISLYIWTRKNPDISKI